MALANGVVLAATPRKNLVDQKVDLPAEALHRDEVAQDLVLPVVLPTVVLPVADAADLVLAGDLVDRPNLARSCPRL